MDRLLEVSSLCFSYGSLRALDDVTFSVAEGEAFGVVGPNGAGKSTLFDLLTALRAPAQGDIVFAGSTIRGHKPHQVARRGIGRTFQVDRTFESMTAIENVTIGAHVRERRGGRARRSAEHHLASVGLADRSGVAVGDLTLDERRRVELARALAIRPRLLLIDEFMGGLTPAEIVAATEMLRGLVADGLTLVVIEHVLDAIRQLCDRLMVLNFGRKIADGHPAEVMRRPEVARAYLGKAEAHA